MLIFWIVGALFLATIPWGIYMSRRSRRLNLPPGRTISDFEKFQLPGQNGGFAGPTQLGSLGNLAGTLKGFDDVRETNDIAGKETFRDEYFGD